MFVLEMEQFGMRVSKAGKFWRFSGGFW